MLKDYVIPILFVVVILSALSCLFITYFDIARNKQLSNRKKADLYLLVFSMPFMGSYIYYFRVKAKLLNNSNVPSSQSTDTLKGIDHLLF